MRRGSLLTDMGSLLNDMISKLGSWQFFFDLNKVIRLGGKNHQWAVTWWSVLYLSVSSEIQANFQLMCFLAGHKAEYGSPARNISVAQSLAGASLLNLLLRLQVSDLSSAISHHFSLSEICFGCDLACGITFN